MMEEKYPLADWLNYEISDEATAKIVGTPAFETLQKIKKYSATLQTTAFDEPEMLATILASKNKNKTNVIPLYNHWVFKVAAIILLSIGSLFMFQNFTQTKYVADIGQKTNFTLPDASEVALNAGSEIEYQKYNWDRNVDLNGEAYFKVAKGKRFEVATSLGKVAVLGTEFDVKSRENRLDVTCYEGRVQVNYKKYQVLLSQGQSVTFENNKQIDQTVTISKPEWLRNKIVFDKENLMQIIAELERNYDVKIKANLFQTGALFTGKVPSDNLEVALNSIAATYQLKIIKTDSKSIIFEKK